MKAFISEASKRNEVKMPRPSDLEYGGFFFLIRIVVVNIPRNVDLCFWIDLVLRLLFPLGFMGKYGNPGVV